MSERSSLATRPSRTTWHDGDLVWVGLLLAGLSAALMIALVWWLCH